MLNKKQEREVMTLIAFYRSRLCNKDDVARTLSALHRAALIRRQKDKLHAIAEAWGVRQNPEYITF